MELTFRPADLPDLELLAESRLRAIRTYRRLSETTPLPEGLAEDQLVATGGIDFRREMPTYHNPLGMSGHIMNIWTDPDFRGQGIARRILDILTAEAGKRGCLTVSLHATAMGRPLYEKYGFTATDDEMEMDLPAEKSEP